ncbi:enoyl-CoA hydratase-related protein [Psychrobacter sp. CAL346-MNA-CIBAN-0220]|uniref:enoyl-CoA hydratase-related protein n=1 Tax=Psychrobacter sp. CAL346-MNA-CIBAN-0220 TaxID=3140457 RepID=UPI00332B68D6
MKKNIVVESNNLTNDVKAVLKKYEYVNVIQYEFGIYKLSLNRPEAFNALNDELMFQLSEVVSLLQHNNARCLVLTGNKKAFAAGGDISEMSGKSYAQVAEEQYVTSIWSKLEQRNIPIVAAVNGLALGGGCELAMLCDIIVAGHSATFGLPEVGLGIIPGAGGTQRLIRAVGKAKAMDVILSGKTLTAIEAERSGLVSRIVEDDKAVEEALYVAHNIAKRSKPVISMAKKVVDYANESSLQNGMQYEQQNFYATFALSDQKEGMKAFLEKRQPNWQDK